jgi:hypothetical protein
MTTIAIQRGGGLVLARKFTAASSQRLSANAGLLSSNGGPFTVLFWMRSRDVSQANRYVAQVYRSSSTAHQWAPIYGYVSQSLEFFANNYFGTNPRTDSGIAVGDTRWHLVGWRKDAAGASGWHKFLDGVRTQINGSIDFTLPSSLDRLIIGGSIGVGSGGDYADIEIAGFYAGNVALTDAEIAARMTADVRTPPRGAVVYYPFQGSDRDALGTYHLTPTNLTDKDWSNAFVAPAEDDVIEVADEDPEPTTGGGGDNAIFFGCNFRRSHSILVPDMRLIHPRKKLIVPGLSL